MCQQVEEEEEILPDLLVHLQVQVVLEADLLDVLEEAGDAPEEQAPAQRPSTADETRYLQTNIMLIIVRIQLYSMCEYIIWTVKNNGIIMLSFIHKEQRELLLNQSNLKKSWDLIRMALNKKVEKSSSISSLFVNNITVTPNCDGSWIYYMNIKFQ